jgi:hypothetical protein
VLRLPTEEFVMNLSALYRELLQTLASFRENSLGLIELSSINRDPVRIVPY